MNIIFLHFTIFLNFIFFKFSGYVSRSNLNRSHGTEGADSVMDLKRELRQKQQQQQHTDEDTPPTSSTSESSSSRTSSEQGESIDRQEDVNHDYQTMDRSYYEAASTFRPQQPAAINTATPRPTPYGRSLPKIPANESMTIPSVPGYAKPFAHISMGRGNLPPPPAPPSSSPPPPWNSRPSGELSHSTRLLETSLDDDNDVRARMDTAERVRLRSRSMGQILETNFDAPNGDDDNQENLTAPLTISHSRSLGGSGFLKLSLGAEPLETDM